MMNRIQTGVLPAAAGSFRPGSSVESAIYSLDSDDSCAFFTPLHYECNYAYPLLVWLHGPRGDENHLKKVMPLVSMRNYVALGLRGTVAVELASGRSAYEWSQAAGQIHAAEQRLLDGLARARDQFNIAAGRIFLAGHACGGTMAFRLAMRHPRLFAGALSLSGGFPSGQSPLAQLAEARNVPLFLACGRTATRYATSEVCDDLRLFHTAGISVTLRQYPCGDELTPQMFSDMDRWIMEQILPSAQTSETADQLNHPPGGLN